MAQVDVNAAVWQAGSFASDYDNRVLEPAEVLLLVRHREDLSGRVLDVGCGTGRLLGYLLALGARAEAIDISERMVQICRRRYPAADVRRGDLADLKAAVAGPFHALWMSGNVLDVLDDERRRAALRDAHDLLVDDGLLLFSSHNLASLDHPSAALGAAPRLRARAVQLANRSPAWMVHAGLRAPRRRANRRRLGPLQQRTDDHAIVNDEAHDYGLLHYYISRREQERELSELGFQPRDVLEFDGTAVADGQDGRGSSIYYTATVG
jgi:SAM-dependent methyltransferase